jgi:hypothetical protein
MRLLRTAAIVGGWLILAPSFADAQWATLSGRIQLPAPVTPPQVQATTDKEFCTKDGPLLDESILTSKDGGVQNVVVWLRPDSDDRSAPFPADKIKPELANASPVERVIDQPCCQFIPRVTVARTGDKLVIKNSAKVAHNTNMSGGDENPALVFNINLPAGGSHTIPAPLAAQRTPIPFKCDIHPWMKGYIRIFDHPYFAITDENGKFTIKDAPVGKWRMVIWHEGGFHKGREGVLGLPVEIKPEGTTLDPINLELPK